MSQALPTNVSLPPCKPIKAVVGGQLMPPSADSDLRIWSLVQRFVQINLQFTLHPLGGVLRWQYDPTGDKEVPEIGLKPAQLCSADWSRCLCGVTSQWIDLDHHDAKVRLRSEQALREELDFANFLTLKAVCIPVPDLRRSTKLAEFLRDRLWSNKLNGNNRYWISFKTNPVDSDINMDSGAGGDQACAANGPKTSDNQSLWRAWRDFRTKAHNHHNLVACLEMTPDLDDEFCDKQLRSRWMGEQIGAVIIPLDLFTVNAQNVANLPYMHDKLVRQTQKLRPEAQMVLRSPSLLSNTWDLDQKRAWCDKVKHETNVKQCLIQHADSGCTDAQLFKEFEDHLQLPLQPMSENLDSHTYEVFEKDPVKYVQYRHAIQAAMLDLYDIRSAGSSARADCTSGGGVKLVVMVLGAGRGPLVTETLLAFQAALKLKTPEHSFDIDLYAVEKNRFSFMMLQHKNEKEWQGKVHLINSDMRKLVALDGQADLIISELLGSFGDNELSPECLDGAQYLLKSDGISIPQSYTSYVEPINSQKMYNNIFEQAAPPWNAVSSGRKLVYPTVELQQYFEHKTEPGVAEIESIVKVPFTRTAVKAGPCSVTDLPYVIQLLSCHTWSNEHHPIQPVLTFVHPNPNINDPQCNYRTVIVKWTAPCECEVSAFKGYFNANLYKNRYRISIEPETKSIGMFSWFPMVLPLREPVLIEKQGTEIELELRRCGDDEGVWYEWRLLKPIETPLQNVNGKYYYMRCNTGDGDEDVIV